MKLLFDENLSDRIVPKIIDLYPDSTHVKTEGLEHAADGVIWSFAKEHGLTIVSKDADFHQRSLLFGHPPKLIYLRVGNCSTTHIIDVLRTNYPRTSAFNQDRTASILILGSS